MGHWSGPGLAVTYANDRFQDGAGAQLQRIYGIYALSRFLSVPYIHSPLAHVGYQGLTALENNAPSTDLVTEYNRVFHIPSDIDLPEEPAIHEMRDADARDIQRIRDDRDGDFHLIRIVLPYTVTDRYPELYRYAKAISPFTYRRSDVFRLAIHVRRGELFAVEGHRMLPNQYYVSCALRFRQILKSLEIPFVCELYTEVPTKAFVVTPRHHGIDWRISGDITFDPALNHLEDFDEIPDLERHINTDPIEAMRRMATADALIISRSCFSYLPAILSPKGIVIYHPCVHSPMKDWLISGGDGSFPENHLIDRLKAWKLRAAPAASIGPRSAQPNRGRAKTPLYESIDRHREEIVRIAAAHGAGHLQAIGSIAHGEARLDEEIDLLVQHREETGPIDRASLAEEIEGLLDRKAGFAMHDGSEDGALTAYYRDIVRPRILRTEPFADTTDRTCELHVLTCKDDWLNLIWGLKSFYHYSQRHYALCIHDDGTIPAGGLEQLHRHFPAARIISRDEADARAQIELGGYPRCLEFRRKNRLSPKALDFSAFLAGDRMLIFDSDLLFFEEPAALLERIEDPGYRRNIFNTDCNYGYTVSPDAVREQIGHELVPLINVGLGLVHKGSMRPDWCEEFLGLPGLCGSPFWWVEEQTVIALCSSRFGVDFLPEEYTIRLDPGLGGRPIRHYIGRIRDRLMYSEGIRTLDERNFLPWRFLVLLDSGGLA
jgi:predicted nucleotidyltransferase